MPEAKNYNKEIKRVKSRGEGQDTKVNCTACGKEFLQSGYSQLADSIMQHQPACSYECNKKLGQAK